MKKISPYIFPAIVLGLVLLLVVRWYNLRTERMEAGLLSEGVVIENLSEEEVQALSMVEDYESVEMQSEQENTSGEIRYEVVEDRVTFTVAASFPEAEEGATYQVWLKETTSDVTRYAFDLELKKGGYMGSAAFSASLLPLEVVVRQETAAGEPELAPVLTSIIEAPAQAE